MSKRHSSYLESNKAALSSKDDGLNDTSAFGQKSEVPEEEDSDDGMSVDLSEISEMERKQGGIKKFENNSSDSGESFDINNPNSSSNSSIAETISESAYSDAQQLAPKSNLQQTLSFSKNLSTQPQRNTSIMIDFKESKHIKEEEFEDDEGESSEEGSNSSQSNIEFEDSDDEEWMDSKNKKLGTRHGKSKKKKKKQSMMSTIKEESKDGPDEEDEFMSPQQKKEIRHSNSIRRRKSEL